MDLNQRCRGRDVTTLDKTIFSMITWDSLSVKWTSVTVQNPVSLTKRVKSAEYSSSELAFGALWWSRVRRPWSSPGSLDSRCHRWTRWCKSLRRPNRSCCGRQPRGQRGSWEGGVKGHRVRGHRAAPVTHISVTSRAEISISSWALLSLRRH